MHRFSVVAVAALATLSLSVADAYASLDQPRPYIKQAIKKTLGSKTASQFTTDNCEHPTPRSWTCLWHHPDRGVNQKYGGSATVNASTRAGKRTVVVTGFYYTADSANRKLKRYTTSAPARICG